MLLGTSLFRLLGDDARLRILRLLAAERLNVSELTGILGLAQSGVSRHLGMLKEAGLIAEQREGVYTWYRLAPSAPAEHPARRSSRRWAKPCSTPRFPSPLSPSRGRSPTTWPS